MLNYSDYKDNTDVSLIKNILNNENNLGSSDQKNYEMKQKPVENTNNKLNHIIALLEQKQDEKTETVFEELVLYLFLGFLIIYIIDSFVRVGKYVR
jgi:hypothetical protein